MLNAKKQIQNDNNKCCNIRKKLLQEEYIIQYHLM